MKFILYTFVKSLVVAAILFVIQFSIGVSFMGNFMKTNLLNILVTLLAINTATTAVLIGKMHEISQQHQRSMSSIFGNTKAQMLLSIKEQIGLIGIGLILSILSSKVHELNFVNSVIEVLLVTVFIYALHILYDTAVSVLSFHD